MARCSIKAQGQLYLLSAGDYIPIPTALPFFYPYIHLPTHPLSYITTKNFELV